MHFVYLLTLSSFLSISLFEGLVIIGLFYTLYLALKGKVSFNSILTKPLLLHAFALLLSTTLYAPHYIGKAIERSLFFFVFPLGGVKSVSFNDLYRLNLLLQFVGILLLPVVAYNYYKTGLPAPLWGGVFEVAMFYFLFSLSSLALFFYRKNHLYLLAFLLFLVVALFSARRSTTIGFFVSLFLFLYLVRKSISKRVLTSLLLLVLVSVVPVGAYLVEKDHRFKTLYEILSRRQAITEQTLDTLSSLRWQIFKAGVQVVKKDIENLNLLPLTVGHGLNAGERLNPPSPVGGTYESVFILSEFIEKGFLGLFALLWLYISYFRFVLKLHVEGQEVLFLPFAVYLSLMFVGSFFTGFWDALLPLHFLWFRMVESYYTRTTIR
ncbi:MAG: hypothetical protein D6699_01135 [Aquificota bacterium]|nr:MAG: hypothetical protein D6699_01135 [Aquificota bacterium]